MTLKRYLTTCYFITLALMLLAGAMMSASDPKIQFSSWFVIAPVIAAVNTFVQIWPFARLVPENKRNGFWSYKWTSLLFIAFPCAMLALGIVAVVLDAVVGA